MGGSKKKIVKEIKVDLDKCVGCRGCEVACSAFHSVPKYSGINPSRARIRVVMDELEDLYIPIRAGEYTEAECNGRHSYVLRGKEYSKCSFCGASCPSRDFFKEPDSGLPLKCDMCEDVPPVKEPMCVQACVFGALTYQEREEEVAEEEVKPGEMETGLKSLVAKYGSKKVMDAVNRISKKS